MKMTTEIAIKQASHVIDLWMPLKIGYDRIPGISISIAHKGKILYAKGFGFADTEKGTKADALTLYHIASISKTFTATAIMQLVETGKVRLDDKVAKYIDWFRGKAKQSDAGNITIRQLLSHSSGIFRDGDTSHWETGRFPKDLKRSFSPASLIIENQTGFKYTNYGYSLLGLIVEKASGMQYAEYIKKHILKPLGMKNTYPDYVQGTKHIATGYGREVPGVKGRAAFPHYAANAYAPATGFVSNALDLSKFISSFSLDVTKDSVLSRESKKEMAHVHEKLDGHDYGLGLGIEEDNSHKIIGHGGGFNGFTTRITLNTRNDTSVVVLTNESGGLAGQIAFGIQNMITRLLDSGDDFSTRKKIAYSKYEGVYRSVSGDDVVARIGDVMAIFSQRADSPLKHAIVLKPTEMRHRFIMKIKDKYDSYDEFAEFKGFKNGKARILIEGTGAMKRVQ